MRSLSIGLAFAGLAVAALAQQRDPEPVWITLGADAAPMAARVFAGNAGFALIRSGERAAMARVDKSLLPQLSLLMHEEFRRCGGFMQHPDYETAWMTATEQVGGRAAKRGGFTPPALDRGAIIDALRPDIDESRVIDVIAALSGFHTRFYTQPGGVDAAHWIHDHWTSLTASRNDAEVSLYQHGGFPQPSVILTIHGSRFPDEIVVLGGHLDSTVGRFSPTLRAPGADDNASGIAVLTETARVLLSSGFQPERTIQFMGYAAEEVGLVGSGEIAAQYQADLVDVRGALQLDMVNFPGANGDIAIIVDFTDSGQNQFVRDLIDQYVNADWANAACGYACSDHASWTRSGFPASFPFEAPMGQHNPSIHTVGDTLARSGQRAEHALKFVELAIAYSVEMAKGELVDGPSVDDWFTVVDLAVIAAAFGPCPPEDCPGDADGDGDVDADDLRLRYLDWNRPKAPSP